MYSWFSVADSWFKHLRSHEQLVWIMFQISSGCDNVLMHVWIQPVLVKVTFESFRYSVSISASFKKIQVFFLMKHQWYKGSLAILEQQANSCYRYGLINRMPSARVSSYSGDMPRLFVGSMNSLHSCCSANVASMELYAPYSCYACCSCTFYCYLHSVYVSFLYVLLLQTFYCI